MAFSRTRSRWFPLAFPLVLGAGVGCGDDGDDPSSAGGYLATGGAGTGAAPVGGWSTGGMSGATGGTGGWGTTGGAPSGGTSTGGALTGGAPTGGAVTGGAATGGAATGGVATGGMATGGMATGGMATGGMATGGASTGGSTSCDESPPPANVAAWIEESWNEQLGDNIRGREAWLLDNVMQGDGVINLCVRWGATTAPSAAVKTNMATTINRWFNDWFTALGDYGCFPYPEGITVNVTGWAVRPGNESWVNDLGPSVAVYTETDGEGEPKCPDACSFFEHWDHQFPNCPGGEAFHTDYWIWLDDQLPGGGAAAVGGDWGLRMPVGTFTNAMNRASDLVIEHEMGHGFGFQDYYTWTGSTPAGGSLMIVGSTGGQQSPTVGDAWLIRRTWLEMRELRGW